jgi:hypothetical protein
MKTNFTNSFLFSEMNKTLPRGMDLKIEKSKYSTFLTFFGLLFLNVLQGISQCDIISLSSSISIGNQPYTERLGRKFTVKSGFTITVSSLGAFDSDADGFASGTTITVGIVKQSDGSTVGQIETFTSTSPGTLSGNFRFKDITPFDLVPGQYQIVAVGFNSNDKNGNSDQLPVLGQPSTGASESGNVAIDWFHDNSSKQAAYGGGTSFGLADVNYGSDFDHAGSFKFGITNTTTAATSSPTVCINTTLTDITHTTTEATGIGTPIDLPAGVTASWASNSITISGTPTAPGIFNYTIPLTGGCGTINATGIITVDPSPVSSGGMCFSSTKEAIDANVSTDIFINKDLIDVIGFTIPTGITLRIKSGVNYENTLTLKNSGTITLLGTAKFKNSGTLINPGIINNSLLGEFLNTGTMSSNALGAGIFNGNLKNEGVFKPGN